MVVCMFKGERPSGKSIPCLTETLVLLDRHGGHEGRGPETLDLGLEEFVVFK